MTVQERHIKARRPYIGPILTRRHRNQRLQWATGQRRWKRRQWAHVLFSDESRFNVSMSDGRDRVWRRRGERYADCCVKQRDRWGDGSVLVWGGITADNRTQLHVLDRAINAQTYRDQILASIVRRLCDVIYPVECFSMTMLDHTWLDCALSFFRQTALTLCIGHLFHQIFHKLSICGMNSVGECTVEIHHQITWTSYAKPLCRNGSRFHRLLSELLCSQCVEDVMLYFKRVVDILRI